MRPDARRILEAALALSVEERRELGEALLESTAQDSPGEIEKAWREEVLRRVEEVRRGEVEPELWSEVKEHIRDALDR